MAVRIKFNGEHMPQQPTFVLANRNGNKLGSIPAIGINFRDNMNSAFELQFRVPMKENGVVCPLWDDIVDFKLLWCPEWDQWFEINVEISDGEIVEKNVSARSVGEAELSQINLYEIEINTENDIARDDYVTTVLYDPNNPEGSLLDRIKEKAPHYTIGHVDSTIAGLQRTFTFDGVSLLDALYEIAEEINCLFVIDSGSKPDGSIARTINVYDLYTNCTNCGYRGEYQDVCPECGSVVLTPGYGINTNIYVSVENLTDDIGYSSNADQVKNCFRLVGGDDLMTATIRNCNPNGTSYIWFFSDAMKADMSDGLKAGIEAYNAEYETYMHNHAYTIPNAIRTAYNTLVTKYSVYVPTLAAIPATIYGYSNLMNAMYDTIDFEMLLRNTLMPTPQMTPTSAATEAAKLTSASLSPTAVTSLTSCSASTASSAVLDVAKQIVDDAYQVKTDVGTLSNNVWTGSLTVRNYSDDEDTATTGNISVTITDDMEAYLKQRINKVLSQKSDNIVDIPTLFKSDLATFKDEIMKYCFASLNSMRDICQSCIDILIEQGVADNRTWGNTTPSLYNELYTPYMNKLNALITEVALREQEIATICGTFDENGGVVTDGVQTVIQKLNGDTQKYLNMQTRLGPDLVNELAAYRREDTYENTNYISDGLDNREVFKRAMEFIDAARNEIYKSATLQHSITSNLKNLLVIKEFEPIVDAFEIGNWITISVAEKTYRLRMISYEIDFDNLENINVEFSDVVETLYGKSDAASILKSASSMSTSYDAVKRQASAGQESKNVLGSFVDSGLALTQMKIINDAENQNVTMDHHGLLCREYLPYDDTYDGKQLKVINRGLYLTDNGWQTSKAGIGQFTYYDPEDGLEKTSYGVIADLLMSNLILSERVGIYNKNGRIKLDQDGFTLVSCNDGTGRTVFRIQRKNGNNVENVIYFDDNGNAHFNGSLDAATGTFAGTLSAECINSGYLNADRIQGGTITSSKLSQDVNNSISNAASAAAAAQTTANGANSQTQLIYKQAVSGTNSMSGTTTWVTSTDESTSSDTAGLTPIWTTKRPTYRSKYPVLFVATQRKTVAGTVTCTPPIKDDTTTVIDGGHITTGTIDATKVTVDKIDASKITSNYLNAERIQTGTIAVSKLTGQLSATATGGTNPWSLDFDANSGAGKLTIGDINADSIKAGYLSANRIDSNTISVDKLTGSISNNNWVLNLTNGTFTIGNISADKINAGHLSADYIQGGTLTLGGNNNESGSLTVNNSSGTPIGTWDSGGITINSGKITVNGGGTFNNITVNNINAVGGTFSGKLNASVTEFNAIKCIVGIPSGGGVVNPNAFSYVNIGASGIVLSPPAEPDESVYGFCYCDNGGFSYGANNAYGSASGLIIVNGTNGNGTVKSEVTYLNLGSTAISQVVSSTCSAMTRSMVQVKTVTGTTSSAGNISLGLVCNRYAVVSVYETVSVAGSGASIVQAFKSASDGDWYAHITSVSSTPVVRSGVNVTLKVAYIDLGIGGFA